MTSGNRPGLMGATPGVFTLCHVVCRPTVKEAEEYLHYYADENADWAAVDNLMRLQGMHAQSFPAAALQMLRGRFAAGHGTLPLIGDPDTVARELARISAAGFAGLHTVFCRLCAGSFRTSATKSYRAWSAWDCGCRAQVDGGTQTRPISGMSRANEHGSHCGVRAACGLLK